MSEPTPLRGMSEHARAHPDKVAVVHEDRRLSYRELDNRARRLASVVIGMGAGPGRPIAIISPNGVEHFEAAMAAAMAQAPFLPVNCHLKASELAYLLGDAGVGAVIGHVALRDEIGEAVAQVGIGGALYIGDGYEERISAAPADPSLDAGPGPELVFYTSGTTARPKGVVHGGLGMVEARRIGMEGQAMLWQWSADDVYVLCGPAYHASHAGWALTALYTGATTVVLSRFSARSWMAAVEEHQGTRSFMVPAHFIRVLEVPEVERGGFDLSTLRLIVHAAAPCPVAVKRAIIESFPQAEIHELYGASEGGATRITPKEWLERPGSVGLPWPGVEIRILTESGEPVPTGEDGVVWIRPPKTQRFSYRNDPEATRRAWRDDAFTVGDVGHLDGDGYLYITDRISDMVLWGGVNIAPREIEEALFEHPAVVDCAVFGIPDERDGERLKAVVECRREIDHLELAAFVRERLADFKVPHVWEFVDELPRDPSGKVLKRLLKAQVDST